MYSVIIRDHIMIAHSLKEKSFGKAQNLHGSTFIADITFSSPFLNDKNVVVDISSARQIIHQILEPLNYKNLDELEEFKGQLTTIEYLAKYIHDQIGQIIEPYFTGKIKVILGESHVAWASYEEEI